MYQCLPGGEGQARFWYASWQLSQSSHPVKGQNEIPVEMFLTLFDSQITFVS